MGRDITISGKMAAGRSVFLWGGARALRYHARLRELPAVHAAGLGGAGEGGGILEIGGWSC
jgi:hypothetical protein